MVLADFGREMGVPIPRLRDDAVYALLAHDWPGNVRELRNVLERATILADGEIEVRHLSLRSRTVHVPQPSDPDWLPPPSDLSVVERGTIQRVLNETDWNTSKAARLLGLTRTQLYGRLRRYGLEVPEREVATA